MKSSYDFGEICLKSGNYVAIPIEKKKNDKTFNFMIVAFKHLKGLHKQVDLDHNMA